MMTLKQRWMSLALLLSLAPLALATKLVIAGTPYVSKSGGYQIQFPTDWRWDKAGANSSASRDGNDLDMIYVNFLKHKNAFAAIKKSSAVDMSPQDLAENVIAEFKTARGLENIDLLSNEPVSLGGQPAFRLHLKFRTPVQAGALTYEEIVVGATSATGLTLVGFRGPAIHYFPTYLPNFEQSVTTFQFSAVKPAPH